MSFLDLVREPAVRARGAAGWTLGPSADGASSVVGIMPPDPNATLADEQLAAVAGGDGNLDSSQKNAQNTATGVCAISCVSSVSTFG